MMDRVARIVLGLGNMAVGSLNLAWATWNLTTSPAMSLVSIVIGYFCIDVARYLLVRYHYTR